MPSWDAYKAEAAGRGALALELYVVRSTPSGGADAVRGSLPDHLAYQRRMEEEGRLVLAGPLSDESGAQMEGTGMIVYRAASLEAARALADGDPMHSSGARVYDLRRWLVNEGSLTISVGLSTKAVTLG